MPILEERWNELKEVLYLMIQYGDNVQIVHYFLTQNWEWNSFLSYIIAGIVAALPFGIGIAIMMLPGYLIGLLIKQLWNEIFH